MKVSDASAQAEGEIAVDGDANVLIDGEVLTENGIALDPDISLDPITLECDVLDENEYNAFGAALEWVKVTRKACPRRRAGSSSSGRELSKIPRRAGRKKRSEKDKRHRLDFSCGKIHVEIRVEHNYLFDTGISEAWESKS